jgi:hypothetical protein
MKRFELLGRALPRRRRRPPGPPVKKKTAHQDQDELFDNLSRILASSLPRRQVLRLALVSLAGAALASLGIRPAWARTNCFCNGAPLQSGQACCSTSSPPQPYDTAKQCCTSAGVQQKYPIQHLTACPNRVAHPGHVSSFNGCGPDPNAVDENGKSCGGVTPPPGFFAANFTPCCNAHDICYDTCNNAKATCDTAFLTCMQMACDTAYPPNSLLNRARNAACRADAQIYYEAVALGGNCAYGYAQRNACDCCAGDQPCCPSGQTLCNGVCCDPGETCVAGQCQAACSACLCPCGANPPCQGTGPLGLPCYCFPTTEHPNGGDSVPCSSDFYCSGAQACGSSADCPPGSVCTTNQCCGFSACAPVCSGNAPRAAATVVGTGPTASGQ